MKRHGTTQIANSYLIERNVLKSSETSSFKCSDSVASTFPKNPDRMTKVESKAPRVYAQRKRHFLFLSQSLIPTLILLACVFSRNVNAFNEIGNF